MRRWYRRRSTSNMCRERPRPCLVLSQEIWWRVPRRRRREVGHGRDLPRQMQLQPQNTIPNFQHTPEIQYIVDGLTQTPMLPGVMRRIWERVFSGPFRIIMRRQLGFRIKTMLLTRRGSATMLGRIIHIYGLPPSLITPRSRQLFER